MDVLEGLVEIAEHPAVSAVTDAMLSGEPFETLVDVCRRQAAEEAATKVVSFADMRTKLRPSATVER
jgi:hypothetical protein